MKKIIVLFASFALLFSSFLLDTKQAYSCSYFKETPEEKFSNADAVFLGKVTNVESWVVPATSSSNLDTSVTATSFNVSKYWKGNVGKNVNVHSSHAIGLSCGSFVGQIGEEYLVYAYYYPEGDTQYRVSEVGAFELSFAGEDLGFLGTGMIPSSYFFTRNLSVGSKSEDVRNLQKYLNEKGFTVSLSGAGSSGNETTYFGPATKSALIKFQLAKSISPAVGYFGPITRGAVNSN